MTLTDLILYSATQMLAGSVIADEKVPRGKRWLAFGCAVFLGFGVAKQIGIGAW